MEFDSLFRPRSRLSLSFADENRPPRFSVPSQRQTVQEKAILSDLHRARNPVRDSISGHGRHSPAAASLRKSLEISKLRPTTNLPIFKELPSKKTRHPENDSPVSRKRQKSINLGRRVLSRVQDGVLRAKSISRLPSDNNLGNLSQCSADVAASDAAGYQSGSSGRISGDWTTKAPDSPSYPSQEALPPETKLPQGWSPVVYLEIRQSAASMHPIHLHGVPSWATIRIAAVPCGSLAQSCTSPDTVHDSLPAVYDVLVKLKACDGCEITQVQGPLHHAQLSLGEGFSISLQYVSIPDRKSAPRAMESATSEEFDELCSEIENLLGPASQERGNAFSLKVTYSLPCLPNSVRLVHRQTFGLSTSDRSGTPTPTSTVIDGPDSVQTGTKHETHAYLAQGIRREGDAARRIWQQMRRLTRCEPDMAHHPLRDLALANKRSVDEETLLELEDQSTASSAPWL